MLLLNGMHDQQNHVPAHKTEGMPPLFAVNNAIQVSDCVRIIEHCSRGIK